MRALILAAITIRLATADSMSLSASTSVTANPGGSQSNPLTVTGPGVNPLMSSSAASGEVTIGCQLGGLPPCSASALADATASATFGQLALSFNTLTMVSGLGTGCSGGVLGCANASAQASASFSDSITLLGGTGPVALSFGLTCNGSCNFPAGYESQTLVAPGEETIGVPFVISASAMISGSTNTTGDDDAPAEMSATWGLYSDRGSVNFPTEYSDESGTQYASLTGEGLVFVAPEPAPTGLTLAGILAILFAAVVRRRAAN
jgi:hypothetical protein